MVSPQFVVDFHGRSDARSPLPNVEDYEPDGTLMLQLDNNNLERTRSSGPRTIFKNYIILSLMETEAEMICMCGGAKIKKLYKKDHNNNNNLNVTFWQNESFFERLMEESSNSNGSGSSSGSESNKKIVCWLDCTSRKVKKGRDYLKKQMKEGESSSGLRLRCIGQPQVVEAITKLTTLKDTEGVELTMGSSTKTETETNIEEAKQDNSEEQIQCPSRDLSADGADSTLSIQKISESEKPLDTIQEFDDNDNDNDKDEKEDESMDEESSSKAKENEDEGGDNGGWVSSKKSRAKANATASAASEERDEVTGGSGRSGSGSGNSKSNNKNKPVQEGSQSQSQSKSSSTSGWISTSQKRSKSDKRSRNEESQQNSSGGWISTTHKTSKSSKKSERSRDEESQLKLQLKRGNMHIDEDVYGEPSENKRKVSLPVTSDGWYLAPKGNKRAKYKRDITDLTMEHGGPSESAQTETSRLIVRKKVTTVHDIKQDSNHNTNRKDFKRFRKNSIIKGAIEHSFNKIRFVSLLPKVS